REQPGCHVTLARPPLRSPDPSQPHFKIYLCARFSQLSDQTTSNMSDDAAVAPAENNVKSPVERKSRTSTVSRATSEGEALLKEMGFEDKETPGRRRTRAAIRGDVYTPPTKKERKATATPGSGRRGRPPKKSEEKKQETEADEEEEKKEEADEKKKEDTAAEDSSADGEAEEEKKE
ncbi:hypothetical protein OTU49_007017, partial [Cherax quadricarinatus]